MEEHHRLQAEVAFLEVDSVVLAEDMEVEEASMEEGAMEHHHRRHPVHLELSYTLAM